MALRTAAVEDDALLGLLRRAVEAAANARSREKAEALGRALRDGLLATDGATVDDAAALVDTLAALDIAHLRLLLLLKEHHDWYYQDPASNRKGRASRYGMTDKQLGERWTGGDHMVFPLAAALVREGLVEDASPARFEGGGAWAITAWGNRLLAHWQGRTAA